MTPGLYSWTSRLNYIVYNAMILLVFFGLLNYATVRYGHQIGLRKDPLGIPYSKIDFKVLKVEQFLHDRNWREDAVAFSFDMEVDTEPLMNWNTNMVFLSIVCEFETETSSTNSVTVWDQRIERKNEHFWKVSLEEEWVEYYLTDINRKLKGNDVKVYLRWEHMSTIGAYYSDQIELATLHIPAKYSGSSKR